MRDVFQALDARAAAHPARTALTDDRGSLSYGSLAASIAAVVRALPYDADTVAITGRAGASWIVADSAATLAGRRVVPVPSFFSAEQVRHVLTDAGVDALLCCDPRDDSRPGLDPSLPVLRVDGHDPGQVSGHGMPAYGGAAQRVIYTSGTTGTPRGVVHGEAQMAHAIAAISAAVSASEDDVHLSALPPSLLLEQIAGVFIPLCTGARLHVLAHAVDAALAGDPRTLLAACGDVRPTTTVLVPQLLAAMVHALRAGTWRAPSSLRFVAVGGAPLPLSLVREARAAGLPVIRGYGLSECGSVVAVERPGATDDIDGCCGPPLPGLSVRIADGEVVVEGPTVMQGYLNREPLTRRRWHTGDAGAVTPEGTLVIHGRRDRVMALPSGRNVAADWVEAVLLADPRIATARLLLSTDGSLEMSLGVSPALADWPRTACVKSIRAQLDTLLAGLPDYARPHRFRIHAAAGAEGAVRVIAIKDSKENPLRHQSFHSRLLVETAPACEEFLAIPLIVQALDQGVSRGRYLRYLREAYHHVRHTCSLMAAAMARCGDGDGRYREALFEYIKEEHGHEAWILDDIAALGGDPDAVRRGRGGEAVRVMVGYAYYAVEHVSPYASLGMVHVLEGMSVALAEQAAKSIRAALGEEVANGFSYLRSRGALDRDHVAFFQQLVDGIEDPVHHDAIIDTARVMYRLFGNVFRDLDEHVEGATRHAA